MEYTIEAASLENSKSMWKRWTYRELNVVGHEDEPWGVQIDFHNWTVTGVYDGKQFYKLGVKVGSKILLINGIPVKKDPRMYEELLVAGEACRIIIAELESKEVQSLDAETLYASEGEASPRVSVQDARVTISDRPDLSQRSSGGASPTSRPMYEQDPSQNQRPSFRTAPESPEYRPQPAPSMDMVDYQHSYNKGDLVEVWSQSNMMWLAAHVMDLEGIDKIIVQYVLNDTTFKKKVRATDTSTVRPTSGVKTFTPHESGNIHTSCPPQEVGVLGKAHD